MKKTLSVLLIGLILGVVHVSTGVGLLVVALLTRRARVLAGAAAAAGAATFLSGVPFAAQGLIQIAVVALPAALLAVAVARSAYGDARKSARFYVAVGLLVLLAIKLGQWQGERDLAVARDEVAPRVIAALERYREKKGAYPEELTHLEPAYLPAIPFPRVGWFDSDDEKFLYTYLGDSFLLEFPGVVWVQCAYSPPYFDDTGRDRDAQVAGATAEGGTPPVSAAPPAGEPAAAGAVKLLYKRLTRLFAISTAIKKNLIETTSVKPQNVIIVPNGIDINKFDPEKIKAEKSEKNSILHLKK